MRRAWNVRLAGCPPLRCEAAWDRRPQHVDEAGRGGERLLLPLAQDRRGDAAGEALLAVGLQDPGEVSVGVGVEHLGGRDARRLVHPHVQGRVVPVGETPVGFVELEGGDPEVEQDAVGHAVGVRLDDVGDLVVDRVDAEEAVTEAGQPLPRQGQGLLVTVDTDDSSRRAAVEDRLGVASHAEGGVDADRALDGQSRLEEVHDAVPQHRNVPLCGISWAAHRGPSSSIGVRWGSDVVVRSGGVRWCEVVVRVDPATGPHPIRARRGGSRVGSGSAGGRRSGRCGRAVRVRGPPPRSRPSSWSTRA
jgi:hypothetical protein